jgi:hypothetical protein
MRVGAAEQAMRQRVRRFLAVEMTSFVDLTEAQEYIPSFPFFMAGVSEGTCPPHTNGCPSAIGMFRLPL